MRNGSAGRPSWLLWLSAAVLALLAIGAAAYFWHASHLLLRPLWQVELPLPIEEMRLAPDKSVLHLALLDNTDAHPSDPELWAMSLEGQVIWRQACRTGGDPHRLELYHGAEGAIYVLAQEYVHEPVTHLSDRLVAFSPAGQRLWAFDESAHRLDPQTDDLAGGEADVIVHSGGSLFGLGCLGEAVWCKAAEEEGPEYRATFPTAIGNDVFLAYLVDDRVPRFGTKVRLLGLSRDGSLRWESDVTGVFRGRPAVRLDGSITASVPAEVADTDTGYVDPLASFSPAGQLEWHVSDKAGFDVTAAPTSTGRCYMRYGYDLTAYGRDGKVLWTHPTGGWIRSAVELTDGVVCIAYRPPRSTATGIEPLDDLVNKLKPQASWRDGLTFLVLDEHGVLRRTFDHVRPTLLFRTQAVVHDDLLILLGDDGTGPRGSRFVVAYELPLGGK